MPTEKEKDKGAIFDIVLPELSNSLYDSPSIRVPEYHHPIKSQLMLATISHVFRISHAVRKVTAVRIVVDSITRAEYLSSRQVRSICA
jgi:hypothetical protein